MHKPQIRTEMEHERKVTHKRRMLLLTTWKKYFNNDSQEVDLDFEIDDTEEIALVTPQTIDKEIKDNIYSKMLRGLTW